MIGAPASDGALPVTFWACLLSFFLVPEFRLENFRSECERGPNVVVREHRIAAPNLLKAAVRERVKDGRVRRAGASSERERDRVDG